MAAQQCVRAMGEEHCILHPEEKLAFECQDCDGVLTCMVCVGTVHQSHKMVIIKQTVKNKLASIEQFIKSTKEKAIPDVEAEIRLTIHTLQESEVKFQNEIEKVQKQEKSLKELVERFSKTNVGRLQYLLKDTTDLLKSHKSYLEMLQQGMKDDTKKCEQTVKTGHDVLVHDTETQIVKKKARVKISKIPAVTSHSFSPCADPNQLIKSAFGDITEHMENSGEKKTAQVVSDYTFLDQPKILYESPTSYLVEYNSIHCTPNNDTWLLDINGTLHCHDHTGKEKQTLVTDVELWKICTHPTTGEMFGIQKSDKIIRRVSTDKGETSVMFHTNSTPLTIGCTADNHLVVSMNDSTVRMFSFKGRVLHTYKCTGKFCPQISVCSITNKVALTGHIDDIVTVLDHTLKQMYAYKGQLGTEKFNTAAFLGRNLLVGDRINKNILVLDKDTLVHTVSTKEMSRVHALSVHQDGVLHVGCSGPNKLLCIKIID